MDIIGTIRDYLKTQLANPAVIRAAAPNYLHYKTTADETSISIRPYYKNLYPHYGRDKEHCIGTFSVALNQEGDLALDQEPRFYSYQQRQIITLVGPHSEDFPEKCWAALLDYISSTSSIGAQMAVYVQDSHRLDKFFMSSHRTLARGGITIDFSDVAASVAIPVLAIGSDSKSYPTVLHCEITYGDSSPEQVNNSLVGLISPLLDYYSPKGGIRILESEFPQFFKTIQSGEE
jgi:hypothetical protein